MSKNLPQVLISIPAVVLMAIVILQSVFGVETSFPGAMGLVGANLIAFTACIAFAIMRPKIKAWRYAAFFNAWLFILVLIASIFRFGA